MSSSSIQITDAKASMNESVIRAHGQSSAISSMDTEQAIRSASEWKKTELHPSLERSFLQKQAAAMVAAEHKDQMSSPRRPSKVVADNISEIVQAISAKGGRRRASIEMNHEQMARIQQHLMETQVSEQLRRKVAACDADTAMELEQHQRATKHFIESEVNTELRRAVAGAQASKASAAEHKDQMSSPRTPSKHVADSLVGVIESISRKGSSRRASMEASFEQTARIQQHIMSTEVAQDIRRKVAAGDADTAMELEQHQRTSQHHMETEVNTELRRSIAAKEADAMSSAEHNDQITSPRRPSKEISDSIASVVQSIAPIGNRRRASIEAAHEQTARIQQHIMSTEVAQDIRRKVAAGAADTAMELEQHQRTSQHHMETEVNTELRRSIAAKEADAKAKAEQDEQIASPRRPSKEIIEAKSAINYAIDGAVMISPTAISG